MKLAIFTLTLIVSIGMLFKQNAPMDVSETGYTSEVSGEIDDSADKVISLAGEFPEDLFDWRPGEGVRSVQEVFAHIASANYFIPTMIGAEIPEGVDPRQFEE